MSVGTVRSAFRSFALCLLGGVLLSHNLRADDTKKAAPAPSAKPAAKPATAAAAAHPATAATASHPGTTAAAAHPITTAHPTVTAHPMAAPREGMAHAAPAGVH